MRFSHIKEVFHSKFYAFFISHNSNFAIKQNELKIKQAELKKQADIKEAEADAAYKIQEQEQRKSIEIANTNADNLRHIVLS